ncbi:MAG: hypothetical protein KUG81_09750 [Gammaproteobacteria bacterium]|nr:hypothetical protein [Gammaproteobacteria bacterium]
MCLAVLSGCAGTGKTTINWGIIENLTLNVLQEVTIRHLPTGVVTSTSAILTGQRVDIGLPVSELLAESAIVSWLEQGRNYQVKLALPRSMDGKGSAPQVLVYRIYSGGRATVNLE